jgi:hypothetical protein
MRSNYVHPSHIAGLGVHGVARGGPVAVAAMIGLCLLGVLIVLIVMVGQPPTDRRHGNGGDSGSGGGGRGPRGEGPDGPPPTGHDPEWWPEFERQFAEYVTSTIRTSSQAATRS